jgi:hypothetical protein
MTLVIPRERLEALSIEALEELAKASIDVLRAKRAKLAAQVRLSLQYGDYVTFHNHKTGADVVGTIEKISIKKAHVREIRDGLKCGVWTVPMNMLTKVKPPDLPATTNKEIPQF